jgi:hypothetical protein
MKNKQGKRMTNLRTKHSLLEENIKLKKERSELNNKIDKVLHSINSKMSDMATAIDKLASKEPSKETVIVKDSATMGSKKVVEEEKAESSPIFIPSPDTSGIKSSVSGIQRKTRESDLSDAASKLAELQKNQ